MDDEFKEFDDLVFDKQEIKETPIAASVPIEEPKVEPNAKERKVHHNGTAKENGKNSKKDANPITFYYQKKETKEENEEKDGEEGKEDKEEEEGEGEEEKKEANDYNWADMLSFVEGEPMKNARFIVPQKKNKGGHILRARKIKPINRLDIQKISTDLQSSTEYLNRINAIDFEKKDKILRVIDDLLESSISCSKGDLVKIYYELNNLRNTLDAYKPKT